MSSDGSGIAKISGYTLFVPQTLPGDFCELLILKTKSSYGYAKALNILTPSEFRTTPPCPHFSKCGGCQLMMCGYEYQKQLKKEFLEAALLRIGGVEPEIEFIGADDPLRYRNKMVFPLSPDGSWGFYRERSHDVIPLSDCLLGDEINKNIMNTVSDFIKRNNIPIYNEETHTGIIRRVFIRNTKENLIIVISVNSDYLPKSKKLVDELITISDRISGIILNINKKRTNLVLGEKNILLWGRDTLSANLCGLKYEISPESFFQINPSQTEKLYLKALEFADISENDTVLDIYCGIGTITLSAAKRAKSAIGVESCKEAVDNAKENAVRNNIYNAQFYCEKAENLVPMLIKDGIKPDIVILDPPRKGSDPETLLSIVSAAPKKIVYVSCNPATLARDIKLLGENGYAVRKAAAVDMFPQTVHVETVALLTKIS